MRTKRDKTARFARSQLESGFLLVTIAVLIAVTALSFMSYLQANTSVYAATPSTVVFDFDIGSPPPSLGQGTPFDYTSSEVKASFNSPSDIQGTPPTFFITDAKPLGYNLSMFNGKWLFDNKQGTNYLDIRFNANLYTMNLTFAVIEHEGGPGIEPCYINLTAYMDSTGNTPVGSIIVRGVTSSPENSQGTLSFDSGGQPFNLVRIYVPPGQPYGTFPVTDFFVDNIVITATPTPDVTPPVTAVSLTGTLGNLGWYKSNVAVSLFATDDMSGVNRIEYSYDNAVWDNYVTPFSITTEGTMTVYYRAADNAGNVETVKSQVVKIDKAPPTTTTNLNGVLGTNGWYKSPVTVTLTISDSISGVANTEYSLDGTNWLVYTAPFSVNNEGTNLVYFRSTDVAGNVETPSTQTVKVDTSSPVTTITLSGIPGDVTITLSAADTGSGISKIEYSFDNSNWIDYTAPFPVTNPALTTVYYRSTDMAGNMETVKTKALTGDNTPPVTGIGLNGALGTQGWYTSNVEVSLSATDDWSGVAKTELSFNGIAWTTYTNSFTITNEGATTVYYRSTDVIGNVEGTLLQTVEIDKTAPTGSIVINGDAPSTTSTSVTLTLTSNDAFSGVSEVRYSNDGTWDTEVWEALSTTKTWTLTAGLGAKTVYYQIKDNAGLISATYQDSITLETLPPGVDTTKPVANAGPDQAATEDTIVMLDGSASTDNVAVTTYTWTFTDVTTKTLTGMKPTYTFATPGNYTITLNVTDAAGNWATDTLIIEILDTTDPIADAGQDRTANIGQPISFDASASSDNVGIVTYEWDCGDGTTHTGKTITHTYNASGTYTVTLTVYDAAGNTANHSIIATVSPTQTLPLQTYQLWIILTIVAIGIGGTAALLRKRK